MGWQEDHYFQVACFTVLNVKKLLKTITVCGITWISLARELHDLHFPDSRVQNSLDCCPSVGNLSGQKNVEEELNSEPYQCTDCGKCYSYQSTLRRHVKLECGKSPQFHCSHCTYKTKRKCDLVRHFGSKHV